MTESRTGFWLSNVPRATGLAGVSPRRLGFTRRQLRALKHGGSWHWLFRTLRRRPRRWRVENAKL